MGILRSCYSLTDPLGYAATSHSPSAHSYTSKLPQPLLKPYSGTLLAEIAVVTPYMLRYVVVHGFHGHTYDAPCLAAL